MDVVTADSVPGHRVVGNLGLVIGAVAVPKNKYEAGMKALSERDQVDRNRSLILSRSDAVNLMVRSAAGLGANAVVAVRFDHREVTAWWSEVCAYGTAVCVEPIGD